MPHVDFTKVFTTAAATGKRETLSISCTSLDLI